MGEGRHLLEHRAPEVLVLRRVETWIMAKTLFVVAQNTVVVALKRDGGPVEHVTAKAHAFTHKRMAGDESVLLFTDDPQGPMVFVHPLFVVEVEAPESVAPSAPAAPAPTTKGKVLTALPGNPRCDCEKCGGSGIYPKSYNKERPLVCRCVPNTTMWDSIDESLAKKLRERAAPATAPAAPAEPTTEEKPQELAF